MQWSPGLPTCATLPKPLMTTRGSFSRVSRTSTRSSSWHASSRRAATVGYLSAAFLDLDLHTLTEPQELDLEKFETESRNKIGLIPEIGVRHRSTYFEHIFNHGTPRNITATYGPRFLMPMPLKYSKREASVLEPADPRQRPRSFAARTWEGRGPSSAQTSPPTTPQKQMAAQSGGLTLDVTEA